MILTANNWPGFSLLSPSRTSEKAPLHIERGREMQTSVEILIIVIKMQDSTLMTQKNAQVHDGRKLLWIKLKVKN